MTARPSATATYEPPRVADYGSLRDITAQMDHAFPGFSASGAASVPTGNPPPGGDTPTPTGSGTPPPGGDTPLGETPGQGVGGEETTSGGTVDHGVAGAEQSGGGGGGGGTVSTGGGEASLPFTGFPAAVAAGVGGAIASAGAALRRAVRRR